MSDLARALEAFQPTHPIKHFKTLRYSGQMIVGGSTESDLLALMNSTISSNSLSRPIRPELSPSIENPQEFPFRLMLFLPCIAGQFLSYRSDEECIRQARPWQVTESDMSTQIHGGMRRPCWKVEHWRTAVSSIHDNGESWTTSNQIRKMLFPDVIIERADKVTEGIVEEAIALLGTRGLREASEFIYARKVPLHVAKRVLLHPAERRRTAGG